MVKVSQQQTQQTPVNQALTRQFEGVVVTAPGQKTISVLVKTVKLHQKYQKQYTVSKKYAVHDENNTAEVGDTVLFQECRPISKRKRWYLLKVVKKAA